VDDTDREYGATASMSRAPLSVETPGVMPRGGVVVLQEAFGVNGHITDVCRRIASEGWLAVAPHLYHRRGDPALGYADVTVVQPYMGSLQGSEILADVDDALRHLSVLGIEPSATAIVGFCMGGYISLIAATERPFGAAVTFYGSGIRNGRFGMPPLLEAAPRLRCPWIGMFGDLDPSIPVDEVEELRTGVASSPYPAEVVRYRDAGHGFVCDQRENYVPHAAEDGWKRMISWLERHLS
jgi:carboxymethylenebutenolidase